MKSLSLFLCSVLSLVLLYGGLCPILAQAPKTAKIAFVSARDFNREIYLMNPDGSEQVNLTKNLADDLFPAWSPTGEQILFVSDRDGIRDLYLMDADGKNVEKVFKQSARREHPTWAPDGKQIAYERGNAIYIATIGKQIEEWVADGFDPAWSPDGREIALTLNPFGSHRLVLLNIHTRRQRQVLPRDVSAWQAEPAWTVASDKLSFSWNKNPLPVPLDAMPGKPFRVPPEWLDQETIYIMNRDGTDVQQIVNETGPKAKNPVWSPRGNEIVYTQEIDGHLQLFKVDVGSQAVTQLTHIGTPYQANASADWFDPGTLDVLPQPQLLPIEWSKIKNR